MFHLTQFPGWQYHPYATCVVNAVYHDDYSLIEADISRQDAISYAPNQTVLMLDDIGAPQFVAQPNDGLRMDLGDSGLGDVKNLSGLFHI